VDLSPLLATELISTCYDFDMKTINSRVVFTAIFTHSELNQVVISIF